MAIPSLPTLEFQLLGAPQIRCNGVLMPTLTSTKAQALLYYLAMSQPDSRALHSRSTLATLLWGECSDVDARGNLRKVLQHLRDHVGAYLAIDRDTIGFQSPQSYTVDALAFATAIANQPTDQPDRLQQAIALYHGDFLAGFYVREAPDFEAWMLGERTRLRELMVQGIDRLAQGYADQGDLSNAIATARRLLTLEPWREETHRQLMNWLAQSGQHSAALAQYEICCRALSAELAVEPSRSTRDLYTRLLHRSAVEPTLVKSRPGASEYALVGRSQEWQTLRTAWSKVQQTGVHFAFIAGEPGIGKSRLAEEIASYVQRHHQDNAHTRCYAIAGRLAYAPLADWLRTASLRSRFVTLDKVWLGEIARLLPELLVDYPGLPAPQPMVERWQQKRFFDALVHAFTADRRPLLLILDDLQWCDPETLEWLHYLAGAAPQAPILLVGTMRNDALDEDHPLYQLVRHLQRMAKLTLLELPSLSLEETAVLGGQVVNHPLQADVNDWLYRQTAGNPLFVIEQARAGLRHEDKPSGRNVERTDVFTVAELPSKVVQVIQARLMQLSSDAYTLAQVAATVGRAFTVELLAQSSQLDEERIVLLLDELWRRRLVRELAPGTYDFAHDRLRDVTYAALSPMRRRLLHRRIAEVLEQLYAGALDAVCGQVAAHYELAGVLELAVRYYQQSARSARRLYANQEVIHYLQNGLALLKKLPNTPSQRQQELEMQVELAAAFMDIYGAGSIETETQYDRAFELCQQVEQTAQLFPILWGLTLVYLFQAKREQACAMAEQCMAIAQQTQEPALLLQAHHSWWGILYFLPADELPLVLTHIEAGIAFYDPVEHHALSLNYGGHDPCTCALKYAAQSKWLLGYPDQALNHAQAALRLGRQLAHPFSLAIMLNTMAIVHLFRREPSQVLEWVASAIPMATEYKHPGILFEGMILQGWALAVQGDIDQGMAQLRQGMANSIALGQLIHRTFNLLLLAEIEAMAGRVEAGLLALDEALTIAHAKDGSYLASEIYRSRGELLLLAGKSAGEAEISFQKALSVARYQHTKSLELRATVSLCRLRQQQGRYSEAHALLAAIYGWFTEGFDTYDLIEARSLLAELASAAVAG